MKDGEERRRQMKEINQQEKKTKDIEKQMGVTTCIYKVYVQ